MIWKACLVLAGIGMLIAGVMAQIAWLGLCFGTVIIGVAMLLFSPALLFLPFNFIILPGFLLVLGGYTSWKKARTQADQAAWEKNYFEEQKAQEEDEFRTERRNRALANYRQYEQTKRDGNE